MILIWNRIDQPGKEWFQLKHSGSARTLEGIVVLTYSGRPCHLAYTIECDRKWQTQAVSISGQIGNRVGEAWQLVEADDGQSILQRYKGLFAIFLLHVENDSIASIYVGNPAGLVNINVRLR